MTEQCQSEEPAIHEGQSASFEVQITPEDLDAFARLSGDTSPIHMDVAAAQKRGYQNRVVHGAFLGALVSRMVGVHLPGERALLQRLTLSFIKPVLAGARVRVVATVEQLSLAAATLVLDVRIEDAATGALHARGKTQVGLAAER